MAPTPEKQSAQTDASWPGAALDTAIKAARMSEPVIMGRDGALHAFVPPGFQLSKLPNADDLPSWIKNKVTVDNRASLSAYANRFRSNTSIIFADYDASAITARLDWHGPTGGDDGLIPGSNEHNVTLKLRFSEEFARWNAMAGKLHDQDVFARFLEENATDVAFPEAAHMIELSRDFEATVGQTYKSSVRLENGDRRMVFESESKAKADLVIPSKFTLSIPIYNGEAPDTLTALFRWRPTGGAVQLGFEWHRLEYQRRAHFEQIAYAAAEETGLPVFMGRIAA